jgi:uroporphyrinogen decarboxylase
MSLSHRERLQASITGDPALDRAPVALWRHFPVDDQSPETLAAATLHFQRSFDFDLVKVTPASSFCLRDWGAEDVWEGDKEGTRRYTKRVIQSPQDWDRLRPLDPFAPHLAAQLTALRLLRQEIGDQTPLLQTIFSPLAQARNLAGENTLLAHLRQHPASVMKGLETIVQTTRRFIFACMDAGIDGIFYAVQHAQSHLLSADEFSHFGKVHDLLLLQQALDFPFNMVHLHGENLHFEAVSRYPAEILNWHDRDSGWPLSKARAYFKQLGTGSLSPAFCGGISQNTLAYGTPEQVRAEATNAIQQTHNRRFILGTGCVVPVITPYANIMAARNAPRAMASNLQTALEEAR